MLRFTLKQLQVFMAIAEDANVSRAADSLLMSQSAVSSALAELERVYDLQFFDRIGKKLVLNENGKALRAAAQELIDRAVALDNQLRLGQACEVVNLGATVTVGDYLAPKMIERFIDRHSGVKVKLIVSNTQHIIEQLLAFDLDLALMEGCQPHPELQFIPWREDKMVVFCSPNHPLTLKSLPLDLADLQNAHWVLREEGSSTRQIFDQAMLAKGVFIDCQIELGNTCSIKQMVQTGQFLGCVSQDLLQNEIASEKLVVLDTPFLDLERQYYIAYHKKKMLSKYLSDFVSICSS